MRDRATGESDRGERRDREPCEHCGNLQVPCESARDCAQCEPGESNPRVDHHSPLVATNDQAAAATTGATPSLTQASMTVWRSAGARFGSAASTTSSCDV